MHKNGNNVAFECKSETLSSLYSHDLLILTKSSKSKYKVVHEQKFNDLLSSTCQVSVERSTLDLESEVEWFNTHWGNIMLLELLFSHSKASDANIGIIANFV